tara:strand:- start:439 stop:2316 length:1878 start_codon:yes stop_codon:yes gene_type:complete
MLTFSSWAISPEEIRIDPPHWWAGLHVESLELLVEMNLGLNEEFKITDVKGDKITLLSDVEAQNRDYHYVTISIDSTAAAQNIYIKGWLYKGGQKFPISKLYKFKERESESHNYMGLNERDLIYLVTPDRFANGDSKNDVINDLREHHVNSSEGFSRHGGDIQGLTSQLDYIKTLGVTAVWTMPLLINDMPEYSYHGYAITDHYQVDPRFGGIKAYKEYSRQLHERDMKLVMDIIPNHMGTFNRLFQNPPDSNWINAWPLEGKIDEKGQVAGATITNHRYATLYDPYAAPSDKKQFSDGWFVPSMVDLNQKNPECAKYLTQNSIWWIEELGVDAFRVDTWVYPDQDFLDHWSKEIHMVFPDFFIFSESWVHNEHSQAYFSNRHSSLDGVADFNMYEAWKDALENPTSWNSGLNSLYMNIASDYQYSSPYKFITFLDNHDAGRFFAKINQDFDLFKMGIVMLYSTRGIPCLYYGTEILLSGLDDHGEIREDMPGGWSDRRDKRNVFKETALSELEKKALFFVRKMAQIRSSYKVIGTGLFRHWAPDDDIYSYCWYNENDILFVLANRSKKTQSFDLKRLTELTFKEGRVVLDSKDVNNESEEWDIISNTEEISMPPNGVKILYLKR